MKRLFIFLCHLQFQILTDYYFPVLHISFFLILCLNFLKFFSPFYFVYCVGTFQLSNKNWDSFLFFSFVFFIAVEVFLSKLSIFFFFWKFIKWRSLVWRLVLFIHFSECDVHYTLVWMLIFPFKKKKSF